MIHMYRNRILTRAGGAALSLLMLTTLVPGASAAVKPVVDESYYATLDYYGRLTEGSVVKSYRLNGNTSISDLGAYEEVNNLTDRTEPVIEGDRITFSITDPELKDFYFEGKTDLPFRQMPFFIQISYRMNGVDCEAEDMAGQTGLAEITLDITPNPEASVYQKNNFALEAMAIIKDSKTLSVEAPGGQLQKVGDMDVVLFLALPGEERHFTLRIGSEDFSFTGFTFLCQPATLAQLDQVAELRKAKEDLEDSARQISDSLDEILDSLDGMEDNLRSTANGLDQLNRARAVISAGKQAVYNEADRTLSSLTNLTDTLQPVADHISTAKAALEETTGQVTELSLRTEALRPQLQSIRDALSDIRDDLNALHSTLDTVENDSTAIIRDLRSLEDDLLTLQIHMENIEPDVTKLRKAVDKVDGLDLELKPVNSIPVNGTDYTVSSVKDLRAKVENAIFPVCCQLGFDDSGDVLILPRETALTEFIMTHAREIATALVANDENAKAQIEAAAQAETAKQAEAAVQQLAAAQGIPLDSEIYQAFHQQAYPQAYETAYPQVYQAVLDKAVENSGYAESFSREDQARMIALVHYQWDDGVGVKDQLGNIDVFNQYIRKGNDEIDEFNDTVKNLTIPASTLLDDVVVLMKDLDGDTSDDAQSLLRVTQDLIAHVTEYDRQTLNRHTNAMLDTVDLSLEQTDRVIEQAGAVTDAVTKYEPDAQSALDDAARQVESTITLLKDMNTFGTALENLMKSAGPDLDQGTKTTLDGLSATLRQASNGLGSTGAIRRAKDTITRLVEDKWDEYTGDVNNLLNADADAEMVSLTSPENQTPNSIQLILRSQEIKLDEEEAAARNATEQQQLGFWGRVGRMFHDFAAIFTGD